MAHYKTKTDMTHEKPPVVENIVNPLEQIGVGEGMPVLGESQINHELGIRATTFAEAQALPRQVGEDTMVDLVTGHLKGPTGEKVHFAKSYLDQVAPSHDEQDIAKNPDRIADLHDQATDVMARNMKLRVQGLDQPTTDHLRRVKSGYLAKLARGKAVFRQVSREIGQVGRTTTKLNGVQDLSGFVVQTDRGKVDLSDLNSSVPGVRSNIRMQGTLVEGFMHWETDTRTDGKLKGSSAELTKRIYLNPETAALSSTFETIMTAINAKGYDAMGKMLMRGSESLSILSKKGIQPIRGDAIVLGIPEKHADEILALVLEVYKADPTIFAGRSTPKIPVPIAPGIAVGEEKGSKTTSLTASRAMVLEEAASDARKSMGWVDYVDRTVDVQDRAKVIRFFRAHYANRAKESGINLHNIAFAAT